MSNPFARGLTHSIYERYSRRDMMGALSREDTNMQKVSGGMDV